MACRIFLDQGSDPCPLHWQADTQPLDHQGTHFSYIYLELDLLVHGDFHLFGFRRYCHHFPKFSYQRIPPLAGFEGSSYSVSTPTLAIVFFILVFLVSKYYWYCSILLLCLSLITYKLKHFLMFIGHLDFVKCLFCCPFFC